MRWRPVFLLELVFLGLLAFLFFFAWDYNELSQNVIENLIATLIWVVILVPIIYFPQFFSYRRRLRRFFGIQDSGLEIIISNLQIREKGAAALEDTARGYMGSSISALEYEAAVLVREKLGVSYLLSIPDSIIPDWVFNFVGNVKPEYKEFGARIRVSYIPRYTDSIPETIDFNRMKREKYWKVIEHKKPLFVIGSNIYNSITKYYCDIYRHTHEAKIGLEEFPQFIPRTPDGRVISRGFNRRNTADGTYTVDDKTARYFQRPLGNAETQPGFILRFKEDGLAQLIGDELRLDDNSPVKGRSVFICAGIDRVATAASVRYLLHHWEPIARRFKDNDFIIYFDYISENKQVETIYDIKLSDINSYGKGELIRRIPDISAGGDRSP